MASKKLTRRQFLRAGAVGTAGLAAAASGLNLASAAPMARRRQTTTVTLVDPWAATGFNDAQVSQIQRFNDSHPNIHIERNAVNFDDFVHLLVQGAAAGQLPDVALIDNPNFHGFAALG